MAATGTYRRPAKIKPEELEAFEVSCKEHQKRLERTFTEEFFDEQVESWEEELRSYSTEYEDLATGKVYSGLDRLVEAGWQIFGLDLGHPLALKGRRLEVGEISARLDKKVP